VRSLHDEPFVLVGEIVVITPDGFDFPALLARLHPASSRVERLRREAPAEFICFDVLAAGGRDLRDLPFVERRDELERLLAGASRPLHATTITRDRVVAAEWLADFHGGGVDGVVAKHESLRYEPGKRRMVKVKRDRTIDCVVGGFRWFASTPIVSSLLLGLYDESGRLEHVGVVTSFTREQRLELTALLRPRIVALEGHPWEGGFLVVGGSLGRLKGAPGRWTPDMVRDWEPLAPVLVCEVGYDQVDGRRLRHPARFRRWRPDREARSCSMDQLSIATPGVDELLAGR
jgi:ATP-dependent DNA ligase